MSDTGENFKIGDLVWAKMKGFPPWPGRISEPSSDLKKPTGKKSLHCIYFFGSKNYGWIEECHLKDYSKYREELTKTNKSPAFRDAVSAIENYVDNKEGINGTEDVEDIFEKVKNSVAESSTPKVKRKYAKKDSMTSSDLNTNNSDEKIPTKKAKLDTSLKREKLSSITVNVKVEKPSQILANHTASFTPKKYQTLLDRPLSLPSEVDVPPIDLATVSPALKEKNIKPSQLKFGFLGLGNMGSGILKNMLNSGHRVIIWNRTSDKCDDFVKFGAEVGMTPSDVVQAADITFSCVTDSAATKEMVFGNCGVLSEMTADKAYVEMTSIDDNISRMIADGIATKGGRYLEAQIQGSKSEAELGTLVIITAGDKMLFEDCQSCFLAMSKNAFYLGEVGNATKINIVLQMIRGITLAGLAEALALADRAGLQHKDLLEILQLTSLSSPVITENVNFIIEGTYRTNFSLQHMQKDMKLALSLGDQVEQPLPITATSNEVYKDAKRLGYGDRDASAVYIRARY